MSNVQIQAVSITFDGAETHIEFDPPVSDQEAEERINGLPLEAGIDDLTVIYQCGVMRFACATGGTLLTKQNAVRDVLRLGRSRAEDCFADLSAKGEA